MEKNNISNAANETKYENQLSVVNADILSVLFDLKRIKDVFEKQYTVIRKGNLENEYFTWRDKFFDSFLAMQDVFNKMLIESVEQNIENRN